MSIMWLASGLAAVLLIAEVVLAQPPLISLQEAERAQQLLNSSELVNKAWGVYIAGRLRRDDLNQLLIEQFQFARTLRDAPFRTEKFAFLAVLFDAAIESHIEVPSALLEPFVEKWICPKVIGSRLADGEQSALGKKVEAMVCGDAR